MWACIFAVKYKAVVYCLWRNILYKKSNFHCEVEVFKKSCAFVNRSVNMTEILSVHVFLIVISLYEINNVTDTMFMRQEDKICCCWKCLIIRRDSRRTCEAQIHLLSYFTQVKPVFRNFSMFCIGTCNMFDALIDINTLCTLYSQHRNKTFC